MKKRPLTLALLGLFLYALVVFMTWNMGKKSETTQYKPQPQTSLVTKSKPRLVEKTKKAERKSEEGFRVVTSVSMYNPSEKSPEN
jgi:hypothetical protein